ncbi:MAG: hypothetical protein ACPLSJ_02265 [Thermosulfidibacteraceae bacterium]
MSYTTVVSLGNQTDLNVTDFLDFLRKDKETKIILLYLKGLEDRRRFIEVASKTFLKNL